METTVAESDNPDSITVNKPPCRECTNCGLETRGFIRSIFRRRKVDHWHVHLKNYYALRGQRPSATARTVFTIREKSLAVEAMRLYDQRITLLGIKPRGKHQDPLALIVVLIVPLEQLRVTNVPLLEPTVRVPHHRGFSVPRHMPKKSGRVIEILHND